MQGGSDSGRVKERGEVKRKKVIPTHHSAGCCRGVAERFIDHLRMHCQSGQGERRERMVERHDGEMEGGNKGGKEANMNE